MRKAKPSCRTCCSKGIRHDYLCTGRDSRAGTGVEALYSGKNGRLHAVIRRRLLADIGADISTDIWERYRRRADCGLLARAAPLVFVKVQTPGPYSRPTESESSVILTYPQVKNLYHRLSALSGCSVPTPGSQLP